MTERGETFCLAVATAGALGEFLAMQIICLKIQDNFHSVMEIGYAYVDVSIALQEPKEKYKYMYIQYCIYICNYYDYNLATFLLSTSASA